MAKSKGISKKTFKPIWLFVVILILLSTFVLVYFQQKKSFELEQADAATYLYDWRATCDGKLKTHYLSNYRMSVACEKTSSSTAKGWARICGGMGYIQKDSRNSKATDFICLKKK